MVIIKGSKRLVINGRKDFDSCDLFNFIEFLLSQIEKYLLGGDYIAVYCRFSCNVYFVCVRSAYIDYIYSTTELFKQKI